MKKTLVLLSLAVAASAFSQGTVNFLTRDTVNGVSAIITYTNNTGAPTSAQGPMANAAKPTPTVSVAADGYAWGGINAKAGLYGGAAGTAPSAMVLLVPAVGFRTGAAAGYVDPGSDAMRTVAGVAGNQLADFQVRAWDTGTAVASYEEAVALSLSRHVYLGQSEVLANITLGNFTPVGGTPTPPAALAGLKGFTMDYVGSRIVAMSFCEPRSW